MDFTFSCGGTQKCVQNGKKLIQILCLSSQKAGQRTACVWKMLIIPPPLATALHRSSHMLLYKLFTYNGTLYGAATRLFQNSDQTPQFPPTPGQKKESVWTQKASACHSIVLGRAGKRRKLLT